MRPHQFPAHDHRPTTLRLGLALACAFVAAVMILGPLGCSSTPTKPDPQPVAAQAKPGAEEWDELIGFVPAKSPWVVVARPAPLLRSAESLYEWLSADPRMFGPEGEERTMWMKMAWEGFQSNLGMNPLDPSAWRTFGIDAERRIIVAQYGLSDEETEFLETVRSEIRERLNLEPDALLLEHLAKLDPQEAAEAVRGLHAKLSRLDNPSGIARGFRLAVPLDDAELFFSSAEKLFSDTFEVVNVDDIDPESSADKSGALDRKYFIGRAADGPAFGISATEDGRYALINLLPSNAAALSLEDDEKKVSAAIAALDKAERFATGGESAPEGNSRLPLAPRPLGEPAIGIGVDYGTVAPRIGAGIVADALSQISGLAAADRDEILLEAVMEALLAMRYWQVGTENLSGSTYGFFLSRTSSPDKSGEADEAGFYPENAQRSEPAKSPSIFKFRMTLYGKRGLEPVERQSRAVALNTEDRAFGVSLDLDILFGNDWQRWLGEERGEDIVGGLDHFAAGDRAGYVFFLSAMPRIFAVLVANVETILKAETPLDVLPIYNHRDKFSHVAAASVGANLSGFRLRPRVISLVGIDPSLDELDRKIAVVSLRDFMVQMVDDSEPAVFASEDDESDSGNISLEPAATGDAAQAVVEEARDGEDGEEIHANSAKTGVPTIALDDDRGLLENEVGRFDVQGDHALAPMLYFYDTKAEQPYILLGYELDEESFRAELQRLRRGENTAAETFWLRLEPVAFFRLLTTFQPTWTEGALDLSVLAQRLGPIVWTVGPREEGGDPTIRYDIELLAPPELD